MVAPLVYAAACSQKPPRGTVLAVLLLGPVLHRTCLENMALAPISGCPAVDSVCKEELKGRGRRGVRACGGCWAVVLPK